jgi:hypothetical protein
MKLGSALNFGVQVRRYRVRHGGQAADGNIDVLAAILIVSPSHKDDR